MSKKISKTTEELTEEFFAVERAAYEKRIPAAFPRVETVKLAKLTELTELGELVGAPSGEEVQKPARK